MIGPAGRRRPSRGELPCRLGGRGEDRGVERERTVTEAEWLACTDPQKMLEFLRGKAGGRKLRLFAVLCCRRFLHLLPSKSSKRAVEMAE